MLKQRNLFLKCSNNMLIAEILIRTVINLIIVIMMTFGRDLSE